MHTATLDSLNINDGTIYALARIPIFRTAKKRIDIQPYLQDHGGEIIAGTNYDDVVTHTVPVYVHGTSIDNLYENVQALQEKCEKTNVTFEYKWDDATNSSFAEVLYMEASDPSEDGDWDYLFESKQCLVNIEMTCKPGWYGAQQTIGPLYYSKTPAIIQPSTVLGDLEAPCVLELSSSGSKAIGNKLYIGTRSKERAISESIFNTIKDFQGTAEGGFYNGQFKRTVCSSAWTELTGESQNIKAIAMANSNVGWVAGETGLISRTTNKWVSASSQYTSPRAVLAMAALSSNIAIAFGRFGTIYKTTTAGASWTAVTAPSCDDITGASFQSTGVGWICNEDGEAYRTIDGMATWVLQLEPSSATKDVTFTDIHAASTKHVAVSGYNKLTNSANYGDGYAYITSNGGTAWSEVSTIGTSELYGISLPASSISFVAVGKNGTIWKSTDTITFTQQLTSNTTENLYDITMSGDLGWAVGKRGTIVKTTNGSTFSKVTNLTPALNSIHKVNSSELFVGGNAGTILKSSDGGDTWTNVSNSWGIISRDNYDDTYRLLTRCRTNSTNPDGVQVRASVGWAGGSVIASSAVSLANTTKQQVVDGGNFTLPPVPLSSGVSATPIIKLEAKNGSTKSINVDMDYAALVPQSGQVNYCSTTATAAQPITYDYNSEAVNKGFTNVDWVGSPGIVLNPGLDNNIVVAESKQFSTGTDGYNPVNVTMKYFPRYRSPIVGSTT